MQEFNVRSQTNYCFSILSIRVHAACNNSMLFKWNIILSEYHTISCNNTFIPKLCAVTGGGRSGGVVTVARSWMDDVSGGMVVREGGDGY